MPFELGIAIEHSRQPGTVHHWFVFEEQSHRLQRTLSDLNGTDPHIHGRDPERVLIELSNALLRDVADPSMTLLRAVHADVWRMAVRIRRDYGTLYGARPFQELVLVATQAAG